MDISRGRLAPYLTTEAQGEIAQTRPLRPIFPFMRHLRCSTIDLTPLFLHDSLEELCLEMDYLSHYPDGHGRIIEAVVERICSYVPRLLRLRIGSKSASWMFRRELVPLFTTLMSLRIVVLPATIWHAAFWEALAMLPDLRILHMERWCYVTLCLYDVLQASVWESSPIQLLPGAFQSLHSFTGCFLSMQSSLALLLNPHFPLARLTYLELEFTYANGCQTVNLRTLMESIAPHLECLQVLRIRFTQLVYRSTLSSIDNPVDEPPLEFGVVSAFLSFRELNVFSIQHPHPIRMSEDDLATVAVRGTRFSEILLNPSPRWPHLGRLPSLSCLLPFAVHCHRLVRLGLCMDCRSHRSRIPTDLTFRKLKELYVGTSLVPAHMKMMYPDWVQPARYLATVFPEGCMVANDTSVRLGLEFRGPCADELAFPGFPYFEAAWRTIRRMVPVTHSVRRRMKVEEAMEVVRT